MCEVVLRFVLVATNEVCTKKFITLGGRQSGALKGRRNHGDKGGSCPPCLFGKGGKGGRSAFPLKI